MLPAYADDAFVVLIRDVKRYGGWHFLLYEVQAVFSGIVLSPTNINVEVVLVESIKDDLNIA